MRAPGDDHAYMRCWRRHRLVDNSWALAVAFWAAYFLILSLLPVTP